MKKLMYSLLSLSLITGSALAQEPVKKEPAKATEKKSESKPVKNPKTVKTASGLEYTITAKGNGKQQAKAGDKVKVHYTGTLTDGTKFDSSVDRNEPIEFLLGAGRVIQGWDEGIALLKEGDKATFKIPAALGYGEQGQGSIPPNSVLMFDVELIQITPMITPYDVKGKAVNKTASGLEVIKIVENPKGKAPEKGAKIKVHYTGYLKANNHIFDSSIERGQPLEFSVGKGQVIPGWDEGLQLLKTGEKARLIIPYALAYGERGYPPVIPASSDLIFDVELIEVKDPIVVKPYPIEGKEVKTTASGLQYVVVESGNGQQATAGSKVTVHYTGYFEDGKIFDSSVERGEPATFSIGVGQVIQGWDEGVVMMKEGDKFRFIIPYQLAYGENGRPPQIPAKSTLIFDVELIKVN